jgi:serine/threonine-protein kinase PknG
MKCDRHPCPGTIGEGGYCDTCLQEPLAATRPADAGAPHRDAPRGPRQEAPQPDGPQQKPTRQEPTRQEVPRRDSIRRQQTLPGTPSAVPSATVRPVADGQDEDRPVVPPPAAPLNIGPWWGLDLVPDLGAKDAPEPEHVLMTDATVPAGHWRCRKCRERLGTSHHGQDRLQEGYCPWCGEPYSPETYAPRLQPGDLVDGRYKVLGCVGQGGVGWVYAARDEHLDGRWVALKGLVDSADENSRNAVKAEKHFLLSIDHQRIVRIYDSVFHPGEDGLDLYLVMQFVKGYPLADSQFLTHSLREAIACVLQVLQALDYLHGHGYIYCDLKPSNVMLSPSGVKLIDLGAINSEWSTKEFAAPEQGSHAAATGTGLRATERALEAGEPGQGSRGTTVATDLYAAGRTLEVLTEQWEPLPESLRSVINTATHRDPSCRFGSAAAFADQLSGVLSEIMTGRGAPARLAPSRLFAPGAEALDGGLGTTPLDWWTASTATAAAEDGVCRPLPVDMPDLVRAAARLPEPYPDPNDPAAGYLTTSVSTDPRIAAGQLAAYGEPTAEILLRRCRVHLSLGEIDDARSQLAALPAGRGGWRRAWLVHWHRGLIALAAGDAAAAAGHFYDCSALVPGETAPRFARALCKEYQGHLVTAKRLYEEVWAADRSYEAAVFGLARIALRGGDRATAVETLDRIPDTSPYRRAARTSAIRVLSGRLADGPAGLSDVDGLSAAAERLRRERLAAQDRQRLRVGILETALELAKTGQSIPDADPLSATDGEEGIRAKLEQAYRQLCDQTTDSDDKTILVDLANRVRPTTLR